MTDGSDSDPCSSIHYNFCGRLLGDFKTRKHGVEGRVYAVNESIFYLTNFNYNGIDKTTFFWAGSTDEPSGDGFLVPYPHTIKAEPLNLKAFKDESIILKLPGGKKITDIKWLCLWSIKHEENLGEVMVPEKFKPPVPQILPPFKPIAYDVKSSNITVLDSRTFYISELHYNGHCPGTKFLVGRGLEPNANGIIVPDENGSTNDLHAYSGNNFVIRLPKKLQVYDIDWLSIYCISTNMNLGHVFIPKDIDIPPSLCFLPVTEGRKLSSP